MSKKKKKKIKFTGTDWTELLVVYNLVDGLPQVSWPGSDNDKEYQDKLTKFLEEHSQLSIDELGIISKEIKILKQFLKHIEKSCVTSEKDVWKAIRKIKNEKMLVRIFTSLLDFCWV